MRQIATLIAVTIAIGGISGCAALSNREAAINDVRPQVESNQQATVERFEQKRAAAELSAAQRQLEQGDLRGGTSMLQAILERTPSHRDATLLMAETQLALGDTAAASATLQTLLQVNEADADVHYLLATLAESIGQPADAQRHAQRAYEIEPSNPLYQLTLDEIEDAAELAAAPSRENGPR